MGKRLSQLNDGAAEGVVPAEDEIGELVSGFLEVYFLFFFMGQNRLHRKMGLIALQITQNSELMNLFWFQLRISEGERMIQICSIFTH
jgi:hypothetical protein